MLLKNEISCLLFLTSIVACQPNNNNTAEVQHAKTMPVESKNAEKIDWNEDGIDWQTIDTVAQSGS